MKSDRPRNSVPKVSASEASKSLPVENLDAKMPLSFFAFGPFDVIVTTEMPDNISFAALSMALAGDEVGNVGRMQVAWLAARQRPPEPSKIGDQAIVHRRTRSKTYSRIISSCSSLNIPGATSIIPPTAQFSCLPR
jgi:hypothetical protein